MFFLALLLLLLLCCCAAASCVAVQAQNVWPSRYNRSRVVSFLFVICVCMFVRFCMYQACVWRVCCHISWYTGTAQQQFNCRSRVSSSCLCASSHGVWACVVGAQEEIEPQQQEFNVQCNSPTHRSDLIPYTKHTAVAKAVAHCLSRFLTVFVLVRNRPHTHHWKGCVPPFRLATPPGYRVNPIPKGHLVIFMTCHVVCLLSAHTPSVRVAFAPPCVRALCLMSVFRCLSVRAAD